MTLQYWYVKVTPGDGPTFVSVTLVVVMAETVGVGLRLLSARAAAVTDEYGDRVVDVVTVPSAGFAYGSHAQSAAFRVQFEIVIFA